PETLALKLAGSLSESGSNIGLRTQTIQLLRDSMYRLCEAYLSGVIGAEEYRRLLLRYQNSTIALLAVEQLTGAVPPRQIILRSDEAGGGHKPEEHTTPVSQPEASTASTNIDLVSTVQHDRNAAMKGVAEAVERIVSKVLEADYTTSDECLRLFIAPISFPDEPAVEYCKEYLEQKRQEFLRSRDEPEKKVQRPKGGPIMAPKER
ncbi:MAG: hypothetical protein ACREXR_14780, partial [Gammaproteobacteria bacterium]